MYCTCSTTMIVRKEIDVVAAQADELSSTKAGVSGDKDEGSVTRIDGCG